ncbi:MAG: hypothetical protein IPG50_16030 [Myxococcales bacterium]|nr:hypothetical protein [Myxococcales bacterium]
MPKFDWRKAAERFRAKSLGTSARPDDDDDDDDTPGPSASAPVGWLPFFGPRGGGFGQPELA